MNVTDCTAFLHVTDFQLSPDGGVTKFPASLGAMTGPTSPDPLVASSRTQINNDWVAWRAFNNREGIPYYFSAPFGSGQPEWLRIDVGAENAFLPNWADFYSGDQYNYPIDYEIWGSNVNEFAGEHDVLFSKTGNELNRFTETWS